MSDFNENSNIIFISANYILAMRDYYFLSLGLNCMPSIYLCSVLLLILKEGSHGAAILPTLQEAVGEWGAHTMRNVTYLTRDLTHEGGGHQHLNKVFSSSNASAHSQEHAHAPHRGRGQAHGYGAADEVHVIGPGSGAGAGGEGQEQKHDYYDLSFLAALNEEDKVSHGI